MPDDTNDISNNATQAVPTPARPADTSTVTNNSATPARATVSSTEAYAEVASRIGEAHNILIALSSDPSVDEMAAAIGLSLYLDKLGKRATAIYSGTTPNALEFLKPEETFESTADTLQDFVIALNKDKADHLRYKIDGDYVKIYITPYKTRIAEEDLDFSYGDFNVDLVLALDVANGIDLDSALREHGRIMHNASIINITTGNPGKFGEIEWSDKSASSVSEMIAKLLYSVKSDVKISKEEATAFLTGIVAATNRFSNNSTTPETMRIASKLMESGANQQLVSKNITPDMENEMFSMLKSGSDSSKDPANLEIDHDNEEAPDEGDKEVEATITEKESSLLDDLKAAEASLAQAGAETTPDLSNRPVRIDNTPSTEAEVAPVPEPTPSTEQVINAEPIEPESDASAEPVPEPSSEAEPTSEPTPEPEPIPEPVEDKAPVEKVITPPVGMDLSSGGTDKYGRMLEEALASLNDTSVPATNPAAMSTPEVASAPEINGVPEMNYMPMPGEEILPPPPTPPIDMTTMSASQLSATPVSPIPATAPATPTMSTAPAMPVVPAMPTAPIEPATPMPEPTPTPLGAQPAMQDQVYTPQAADPGAFKIPGM